MKHEYNVGDDAPLSFQVFVDDKPTTPMSARGFVFNGNSKLVYEDKCQINGSNVSFMVKGKYHDEPGEYTAVFSALLRKYGEKKYVLKYNIKPLPVKKSIRDKMQKKGK